MAARTKGILTPPRPAPESAPSSRNPNRPGKPYSLERPLGRILDFYGWTVAELSARCLDTYGPNHGLNTTRLSYYLNGKKEITEDHRRKLAKVLRVKEEWLEGRRG